MKKSLIVVSVILATIALLPIIGNSYMSQTIDERLAHLKSFGLETQSDRSNSTYLNTSRHFEFLLKDSQKFLNYLKRYSNAQTPPYVNAMVDGVLVGADIEYSNLPFAKAVTIEIYPLTLSSEMRLSLEENDLKFSKYVEKLLQSKSVLYHIEYNFLNDDFKGYLKDIQESYVLDSGLELKMKLLNATFKGNGELIAPNKLNSKVKELAFSAAKEEKELKLMLHKFSSKSNFDSQNTYVTSAEFKDVEIFLQGTQRDLNTTLEGLKVNASSNDQSEKLELNTRSVVKKMRVNSPDMAFELKELTLDFAFNGVNKEKYEELQLLLAKSSNLNSAISQEKLQSAMVSLIEKGLVFEVADFSLKSLETQKLGELSGFSLKSKFSFKEDASLGQKIQISPLFALSSMSVESTIKVSQEIYQQLLYRQPMLGVATKYAAIDGDDYIFDMSFIDSKIVVNGKALN